MAEAMDEGIYKDRYFYYADEEEAIQKEQEIVDAIEEGQFYSDPQFLPDGTALYRNPFKPPRGGMPADTIEWNRINAGEIDGCNEPSTFKDGSEAGDVCQGALGNCWFISSLSVLASRQLLIQNLIVSDRNAKRGIYTVRFFKGSKWVYLHIDDKIPCNRAGKVLYGHGKDPNEIWVKIVEKAYAKLHGCYENLCSGFVDEGLRDLTGVATMKIKFTGKGMDTALHNGTVFSELKAWYDEGSLMGCSRQSGEGIETDTGRGILAGHAYGLLSIREMHQEATLTMDALDVKLLQCRNPWGMGEWKGPWSDNDEMWEKCPAIMEALNPDGFKEDGCFWISWEDFITEYNQVFICIDFPEGGTGVRYNGAWIPGDTKSGSGGSPKHPSFPSNPQYTFSVDEPDTNVVGIVHQRDLRWQVSATENYTVPIGYVIMKLVGNISRVQKFDPAKCAGMSRSYVPSRSSAGETRLAPGRYAMIPTTFSPLVDKSMNFILEIFSAKPIQLEQEGDAVADLDDVEEEEAEELMAEGKLEKGGSADQAGNRVFDDDLEPDTENDGEQVDDMALGHLQHQLADLASLVLSLQKEVKALDETVKILEAKHK